MSTEKSLDIIDTADFRLEGQVTAPVMYAEGFTNLLFGFPHTRVLFHTLIEPAHRGTKEQRRAVLTLTIPTILAVQLAQTILSGVKGNERLLMQAVDQQVKNLKQLVAAQVTATLPTGIVQEDFVASGQAGSKDNKPS
jgi:hypothetical protein